MENSVYDLIVVGGGPAGLMCGLTGIGGIPINPPRHFTCLVLDKHEIGEFCKFGKLRITHRWHFMGKKLMQFLQAEAAAAGIDFREHEPVTGVQLDGDIKTVTTPRGDYRATKVAVCTGFFPHGHLARHQAGVRLVFSPAALEAQALQAKAGDTVAILGGGPVTLEFALEMKELRPEVDFLVIVEHGDFGPGDDRLEAFKGSARPANLSRSDVVLELTDREGRPAGKRKVRNLLVDYNSYTLGTEVTGFLAGSGIPTHRGYIDADRQGRTPVSGVFAAGNIVTPISGVLTALDTGFAAGLAIFEELHQNRFGKRPNLFPWLPAAGMEAHPLAKN